MNSKSERLPVIPLVVVILLAMWLRIPGIKAGLPFFYAEDEAHHFNRTVEMVKEGRYDPQYFHKPSLHFYLRMPVVAVSYLWSARKGYLTSVREIETRNPFGLAGYAFTASHSGIVKWNRAFSVLLSLLTVVLAYFVCYEVTGKVLPSLLAAFITAVSPEFLKNSPIIGVDVVMSFMCMASCYLTLLVARTYSLAKLGMLGLVCGLAVSSKYNALPIAVLPFCLCVALKRYSFAGIAVALLTPALGFFLGSPFILVSIPLFLDHLSYEMWHYGVAGHVGNMEEPGLRQALFYARWLVTDGIGWVAALTALAGFLLLRTDRRREFALFIVFPLLFAALMVGQKTNFTRNMMVLIPFVAVLAACGVEVLVRSARVKDSLRPAAVWVALPLLCAQPLIGSLHYVQSIKYQPETRIAAAQWLEQSGQELGDTAVSGRLQFPLSVYRLPRFTRVDLAKTSVLELYQRGFSTIVSGPEFHPSAADQPLLRPVRSFEGVSERQRIIQNPTIDVSSLREDVAKELIFTKFKEAQSLPYYDISFDEAGNLLCKDEAGKDRTSLGEDYCWIQDRFAVLHLPLHPPSARRPHSFEVEIMSPWKDQTLIFSAADWKIEKSLADAEPGSWVRFDIAVSDSILGSPRGILLETSQVHSPASMGINADTRRLGVALRMASSR